MITNNRIYLDNNATTQVDPVVLEEMLPYFTAIYGNAASIDHEYGVEAKNGVDTARLRIARAINAHSDEIIFTSGATESNNLALIGIAEKHAKKGNHIITCSTEHKAILDTCHRLEKLGFEITYLPVDNTGLIDLKMLESKIKRETILVSIMAANNEIGTLAPLAEIGKVTRKNGILFHTDAAQAFGHIPLDVEKFNIDVMSMSAHKIYGPKGVGAIYRRGSNPRVMMAPLIYGGGHEKGLRSGTLNVPGIVGFGKAAEIAHANLHSEAERDRKWTARLLESIRQDFPDVQLNGHHSQRLPNNLNISIPGLESKALIVSLKDIAISTGSACTTSTVEPSHVILALGYGEDRSHSALRISVGRFNSDEQISLAINELKQSLKRVLSMVQH
ncbi:MAG TPA: cysteine desulfurase family protein [Candidatus Babeliaceae bacterium]|nr:cysteine desulfurase family protein [Candidatus Babeliaceae bacterium]